MPKKPKHIPPCPECGSRNNSATTTAKTTCNQIFRYRDCKDCGMRFETVQPYEEVLAGYARIRFLPPDPGTATKIIHIDRTPPVAYPQSSSEKLKKPYTD